MWQHYAAIGIWVALGLAVAAGIAWEAGLADAWQLHRRRSKLAIAVRTVAERQPPLGQLVACPEADRHARYRAERPTEAFNACNRCRTGHTAWPCTCGTDCYSPVCTSLRRDA